MPLPPRLKEVLTTDQVSTTYQIGDATVTRIQELTLEVASPAMLYPEWRDEFPYGREGLLLSIHTWVVQTPGHTILIDTATGNDKERSFLPALRGGRSRLRESFLHEVARSRGHILACEAPALYPT